MKLNEELKSNFEPLCKFINSYVKETGYKVDDQLSIYVKTPHIFYKKVVVYLKSDFNDESLIEITEYIDKNSNFDTKDLKTAMSIAYMNYFIHYHTNFNDPFYELIFKKVNNKLILQGVLPSDSPDPLDINGIQIRK